MNHALGVNCPWSAMTAPDISAGRSVCSANGLEPSERVRPGMYCVKQDPKCSLASLHDTKRGWTNPRGRWDR